MCRLVGPTRFPQIEAYFDNSTNVNTLIYTPNHTPLNVVYIIQSVICYNKPLTPVPDIELRTSGWSFSWHRTSREKTSGSAGDYQGAALGVYQFHSDDEAHGLVYKQRDDYGGTQFYLWCVSFSNMHSTLKDNGITKNEISLMQENKKWPVLVCGQKYWRKSSS